LARREKGGPPRETGLPGRDDVVEFIRASKGKIGTREVARAFRVKGSERVALKHMLDDLIGNGTLSGSRKGLRETGGLPPVAPLEIRGRDRDGDLYALPVSWAADDGEPPRVLVQVRSRTAKMLPALGPGDRVLARITRLDKPNGGYRYEADPLKTLARAKAGQIGIFRADRDGGGRIMPVDRKEMRELPVKPGDTGNARDGDLVRFDVGRSGRFAVAEARVTEALGNPEDERKISLIAIHAHGIPDQFPAAVLAELDRLPPLKAEGRVDLTGLPLLTIDPVDARDHDDAVHAEPDTDPNNPGGWIVTVAIADVAHYVRSGTRLDREAELRGNSVYFPDRVVPMLPELISNDLCSLREGEVRPCLAVRMTFDAHGAKRNHRFERAVMRSAAKLSYQDAQAAFDGKPGEKAGLLLASALEPLWSAYQVLLKGRDARDPLDLDLPERKIVLDDAGRVARIIVPERLAAHRLIEEMMIQANVAAAETLEDKRTPCVYRVHDHPSKEKMAALRDFLGSLDLRLTAGAVKPAQLNQILARARSMPVADLVSEVVLRSQAQAEYATQNYGHFGLHLRRYAHFTSPIRRYADLLVHRALIRALRFGNDGLSEEQEARLPRIAEAISVAERRAMAAERETTDRLVAAYLAGHVGAEFDARISGATRSGLFVRLRETGADGFIPASTLGDEYFRHDPQMHALVGERTGLAFHLGDLVRVRLVEAVPTAGALRFEMLSKGKRQHASLGKGWNGPKRLKQKRKPPPKRR